MKLAPFYTFVFCKLWDLSNCPQWHITSYGIIEFVYLVIMHALLHYVI